MIPFNTQPLSQLKERYNYAIKARNNLTNILANPEERPGAKPVHIFDFEDGIRLIVSRDVIKEMEVIHFSGSINEALFKGKLNKALLSTMVTHFIELSEYRGAITMSGFSDTGIPHFYCLLTNLN